MNSKILSFLGLARRAGQLCLGFDSTAEAIKSGDAILIIFSSDISENSEKKMRRLSSEKNIEAIKINYTMEQIGNSIGKIIGIIAVKDRNFAKKLISLSANANEEELNL